MAVKQLVPANSSKLRKPAAEVKKFDDSLKQLLLDIRYTAL